MNIRKRVYLCFGLIAMGMVSLCAADTSLSKPLLHPLFSDEAVLQRGKPVMVWGWAVPGAEVTVELVGDGLIPAPVTVKAGTDGRWQAALGPFAAGGPYRLVATSGSVRAEAKDVLVGDVWLCSGQSNMAMTVDMSAHADEEANNANWPQIRHFCVSLNRAGTPQEFCKGQWKVSNPENTPKFTAAGYYMARKLHQDLKVPIGLVNSSVGGTRSELWTSGEALSFVPGYSSAVSSFQALMKRVDEQKEKTGKDYPEQLATW